MHKKLLLSFLLFMGCAPALTTSTSGPSVIEVVNTHSNPAEIFVDRDFVTELPGQSRRILYGFSEGEHLVELYVDKERVHQGTVKIRRGLHPVFPSEQEQAIHAIPKLARLEIMNEHPSQVRVYLDGKLLGQIHPNDSNLWTNVAEGNKTLTVESADKRYRESFPLQLMANKLNRATLRYTPTSLVMTNTSQTDIRVEIEDLGTWTIAGTQSVTIPKLMPGTFNLTVYSELGTQVLTTNVRMGENQSLSLMSQGTSISIQNFTNERVDLSHHKFPITSVDPGKAITLNGLPTKPYRLQALLTESRVVMSNTFEAAQGVTPSWAISLDKGSVEFYNDSPEPLRVQLPGRSPILIGPGAMRAVNGLPLGPIAGAAEGRFSGHKYVFEEEVEATTSKRLTFQSTSASLTLTNRDPVARTFSLPEFPAIELGGGESLVLDGLAPGNRTITVQLGDSTEEMRVTLEPDQRKSIAFRTKRLPYVVVNETGEDLLLSGPGISERLLRRGESTTVQLGPGHHTLSAIGTESGTSVEQFVKLDEEGQNEWRIPRFGGLLRVVNSLKETVRINSPGGKSFLLPSGKAMTFAPVRLGINHFTAMGTDTGAFQLYSNAFTNGTQQYWDIAQRDASLTLVNETDESQSIDLDGAPVTTIPKGESRKLFIPVRKLATISLIGSLSGETQILTVQLQGGAHPRHRIRTEEQPVQVFNDGTGMITLRHQDWIGNDTLDANKNTFGTIPSGTPSISAIEEDGKLIETKVIASPGQVAKAYFQQPASEFWIQNKTGEKVAVILNGSRIGSLEAGMSSSFNIPDDATIMALEARASGGRLWRRAAVSTSTPSITWVIED